MGEAEFQKTLVKMFSKALSERQSGFLVLADYLMRVLKRKDLPQ